MIKTLNNKTDRNKQLSKNFSAGEFMCKCGKYCTTFKVDDDLVTKLQKLRDKLGKPIRINSGYRCPTHNKNVGGASASYHTKGMAADIRVDSVTVVALSKAAESVGFKGVIQYPKSNFVHVDTRTARYFAIDHGNGKITTKTTFGGTTYPMPTGTLKKGSKGDGVKWLQQKLGITIDGDFGKKTDTAVRAFQRKNNLVADGIVGVKTRNCLI